MIKIFSVFFLSLILISSTIILPNSSYVYADHIPGWIKNNALWYGEGAISETEFINAIKFLIEEGILQLEERKDIPTDQNIVKSETVSNDTNWLSGIQDTIGSALKKIQSDPTADLVIKSILPVIPIAGPLLANIYELSSGTTAEKNLQVEKLLKEYQAMDNAQLEKSFKKLDANKNLIKKNGISLNEVLIDTKLLLTGQENIKNQLKSLAEKFDAFIAANGVSDKVDRSKIGTLSQETQTQLKEKQKEIELLKSKINELTGVELEVDIEYLEKLANAQLYAENDEEAIEIYKKILDSDPTNFDALNGIGWALIGLDKSAESVDWFKQANAIDNEDSDTLEGLGWAYLDSENPDEAIKWFDKAIAADPENPFAYEGKGLALMILDRWDEAESICLEGLEIVPGQEDLLQCVEDAQ